MDNLNRDILISVKVDNQEAIQSTEALKKKFKELTTAVDSYNKIDLSDISVNDLQIALTQAKNLFKELSNSGLASVDDLKKVSTEINALNSQIAKVENIDIKVNDNIDELKGRLADLQNIDLPNISLDSLNFEFEKSQRLFQDIFNLKDGSIDTDGMLTEVMAVMDTINSQITSVNVPVDIDTNQAESETEALKRKFKDLSNVALSFDEIDFDNSTIGELQNHLKQANIVLKELKASGQASEQQLADMGKTINNLKSNISGMKFDKAFKGFESSVHGVVGTAQLLEGSMRSLGIESESAEKAIECMMQLMTLKDGVESLGKYIDGMKGVTTATGGATKATNLLKLGFQSLGLGLLITTILYVTNNWNTLSATVKEFIPSLGSVGDQFKNMGAIMEGVGKAVIAFVVRPIQSAITAFNLLRDGDWKSAGKEIFNALYPIERLTNVVKDFQSGYNQGLIKAEATENIKNFNAETEKTIKLLEAQGGKEKEIFALKKKMWSNEITQLKKKNKVLSDADQKRVDELEEMMQVEGVKHNKFLTDAGKASSDAFKAGVEEFKNAMVEVNKFLADQGKSERQKELDEIDKHYAELLKKARKYQQDASDINSALKQANTVNKIKTAREIKKDEVNEKFDKEDNEKALRETELVGSTNLLNAKTNNEEKTVADVTRIADVELKNAKDSYEKKKVLAKDNAKELENIEAEYANNVYNINKTLADKVKAIKDKELQDAKEKVETQTETKVLQTETEIINSERGLPAEDGEKPLTDDQIKLVLDNVDRLHQAKLAQLQANYEAERLLYADNAEKLALIDAQYHNDVINLEKDSSDKKLAIKKDEKEKKEALTEMELSSVGSAFSAIGALAEESSIFGKSLATADAIIQTYLGANKAIGQGGIFGWASAIGIIATGLANVKKIMSTKVSNKEGASKNSISAPTINMHQLQPRQTQDVRVVDNQAQQKQDPIKAVVVYRDLESKQEKENFNNNLSSY